MTGVRLEVEVHIVTGATTSTQNIVRSVNRAGLHVLDIVLEQLASAEAVLTDDEKELGRRADRHRRRHDRRRDLRRRRLWHTGILPLGGDHFTNDIAVGLRTPMPEAEKLKKRLGCALSALVREDEVDRRALGGRAQAARDVAPDPLRDPPAARRGDLHPRRERARQGRARGRRRGGHRRDGRHVDHAGRAGARRADLRPADAARARPPASAGSRTWSRARSMRRASGSCSTARAAGFARRARSGRTAPSRGSAGLGGMRRLRDWFWRAVTNSDGQG